MMRAHWITAPCFWAAARRFARLGLRPVRLARLIVPALLLTAMSPAPSSVVNIGAPAANAQTAPQGEDADASLRREVRLRKLHLVRPDLIQYPLSYDVYC